MSDQREIELGERLAAVRERVERACVAVGRGAADVELLPVTKFFPASDVVRLTKHGCTRFGESREPEAGRKVVEVRSILGEAADIRFDMIGRLQRNKAKTVARWADRVHSVDSSRLADALSTAAAASLDDGGRAAPLQVMLQVSLDGDPGRGGVVAADLPALADRVVELPGLELAGLMAIAPLDSDSARWLAAVGETHARFVEAYPQAGQLSAGMSGDLEDAIKYGSTCVRVGTAIMGSRPILSP
ncbi:YggS family pyridoxal phosphate-dependent enzyme [Jongsikchunia kroppenstedtii]|uniref:YggS family pyridoxal phosphate-dependent enzyme n=1 Tax=Jongsikchunia kroppenstedtii TaxID=1121721 RepID=UPI00037D4D27|nr:YggS family pyridoxal phosphate-dependent enzyme [Jongsikchunia kroppenstedtii]